MTRTERLQQAEIIADIVNRNRQPGWTWADLRDEVNWRTDNELGSIELDVITDMVNARLVLPVEQPMR
jgi:hypothetical protein